MPDFVRVKADNGQEISVPKAYAEAFGMNVLDKRAVDRAGTPVRPKSPVLRARTTKSAGATAQGRNRKGATIKKEN